MGTGLIAFVVSLKALSMVLSKVYPSGGRFAVRGKGNPIFGISPYRYIGERARQRRCQATDFQVSDFHDFLFDAC